MKKKVVHHQNDIRKFTYDNIPLSSQLGRSLLSGSQSKQVLHAVRSILDGETKSATLNIKPAEVNL